MISNLRCANKRVSGALPCKTGPGGQSFATYVYRPAIWTGGAVDVRVLTVDDVGTDLYIGRDVHQTIHVGLPNLQLVHFGVVRV